MIGFWAKAAEELARHGRIARVSVVATRGSTPREIGAAMLVRPDGAFHGTIGGGAFEWRALDAARIALAEGQALFELREVVLGPDLGQCCGGRVTLAVEVFDRASLDDVRALADREAEGPFATRAAVAAGRLRRRVVDRTLPPGLGRDGTLVELYGDDRRTLLLYGAGHVGRALVLALAPLPFRVVWLDGRLDAFPAAVPGNVTPVHVGEDLVAAIRHAPAGAFVLAMTHDHALDLEIVDASLRRSDLPWIGVIGSATKRARFVSKLLEMGHAGEAVRRMVCPVGAVGPRSKAPAVIAAAVAVDLLNADELARNTLGSAGSLVRVHGEEEV